MHEDKFEKQVREKMDQLGFDPTDAVWSGVSKEINKEKRRRLPLFWLFLFSGLVLAGGGYYVTKNVGKVQNIQNVGNVKNEANGKNIKANEKSYYRSAAGISEHGIYDDGANVTDPIKEVKSDRDVTVGGKLPSSDKVPITTRASDKESIKDNKISTEGADTEKEMAGENKISVKSPATEKKSTSKSTIPVTDSIAGKKTTLNRKKEKWKIGFSGQAGLSDIKQGSFVNGVSANNPNNANASPGTPAPAAGSQVSKIQPGFAFGVGVFANRNLTQRISLSAGISYHYYSTHVQTGGTANSAAYSIYGPSALSGNYYLNGNGQSYTGNYHFLELPVSVNFQLNKSHKLPIVLDAGLSFAYLLNSNALFFDPITDLYVKNPQAFNKTQLNATTALMFAFHLHPAEIRVGPQFQYGITGLTKEGYGASEHLLFYGMKICFIPLGK